MPRALPKGARRKPQSKPWGKVIVGAAFVSVGALTLAAPSLEQWAEDHELKILLANGTLPGDFVDVPTVPGGPETRKVHRVVVQPKDKSGKAKPVVIINGNIGESSFDFSEIQNKIGEFATCIVYDRLGSGFSEQPKGYGFNAASDELAAVADAPIDPTTNEVWFGEGELSPSPIEGNGQVILVGQGYGALLNDQFLRRHPARVAGVVALDPAVLGAKSKQFALDESVSKVAETIENQTNQLVSVLSLSAWWFRATPHNLVNCLCRRN